MNNRELLAERNRFNDKKVQGDFPSALHSVSKIIKHFNSKEGGVFEKEFWCNQKIDIFLELKKFKEALELIGDMKSNLVRDYNYSVYDKEALVYKKKFFYSPKSEKSDLSKALHAINLAKKHIENLKVRNFTELRDNQEQLEKNLTALDIKLIDMEMKKNEIESILREFKLKKSQRDLANKIEGERVRQFEQLGLFSALIALIITNANFITNSQSLELRKVIVFDISFIFGVSLLLGLGSFYLEIGNKEGDLKRGVLLGCTLLVLLISLFFL